MPKTDPERIRLERPRCRAPRWPAVFLARYDRRSGCRTGAPGRPGPAISFPAVSLEATSSDFIWAKAAIDPRGAVAMIEAMPPGGPDYSHPTNRDRVELASRLAEPPEDHWKLVWRYFGVEFD